MISGPMGVFAREMPGVTCQQIDLEPTSETPKTGWFAKPVEIPDNTNRLIEDLMATPANRIAAHRGETRFEMGYKSLPLTATEAPTFRDGGTYLITGGFGGIGQTLAADILTQHDATVILLSRDALPDRQTWPAYIKQNGTSDRKARRMQAVMRLEELGNVEVAGADVANLAQMRRVIADTTTRHGALTGVIHAAGTLDDGPLLGKSDAEIDAVLSPKVQGLRVIDQLLPDGSVELMVLFSSTSTATRAAGQADYVAANAWLNAFAAARKGGKTRVVALNWGIWADVGMATKALSGGASDVLPPRKLDAALLDTAGADDDGEPIFTGQVDAQHWIIDQHRTKDGQALMPGTGYIELIAEAAAAQGLRRFDISDLYFLRAMPVVEGSNKDLRLTLNRDGDGFTAEIRSDAVLNGKQGWQLHAQATLTRQSHAPDPLNLSAIAKRCTDITKADGDRLQAPQEAHLDFGPRWHVLQETRLGDDHGIAILRLPEGDPDDGLILHPGLMDIATGWAMNLIPGYGANHLWVPVSYGMIRVHGPLPSDIRSVVHLSEHGEGHATFDVILTDAKGNVLVEVEHFAMKRLEGGFANPAPFTAQEVTFDDEDGADAPMTAAEERFAYLVSQGIRAAEGPEALRRALALGRSQVLVSSMPLDALMAQADQPPAEAASAGQSFERTDLEGYVAPRNAIEEKLAEMWEGLLGVSPVGVEDSFFDLGGHSLIAVRLFAAVKRDFKVEFPISVLFEAPTIGQIASLIAAEGGEAAGDSDTATAPARKFDYLVPLNQSDHAQAAPLFIVAGMFGNVLNLRHLALPFSDQRRVFGVQARGLIGDTDPHTTVAEAAADYITEIREVQPEGPYLLSGYSGGGITAYEMAQQLRAAGEEVAVLALLDSPLPVRPSLSKPDKALIKVAEFRRKGPGYLIEWARNRWTWEMQKRRGDATSDTTAPGAEFNNVKVQNAFLQAVGSYDTQNWPGNITLFRPPLDHHWKVTNGMWVTSEKEYVFEDNDWRKYAPHLQVIEVPGDHESMVLTPNVTVLAQELSEVIGAALEDHMDAPKRTAAE